jgi:tRNA(fMet)-specific endonuclease VapC
MIYLPDTNALSAYMRGVDSDLVARFQAAFFELHLSVIVLAEREFGVTKGTNAQARLRLTELSRLLPVVEFTREDCAFYAAIRTDLEARGFGIGPMDTLIAAQALRLGACVITRNTREFGRVVGLQVENWQSI